MEVHFAVISAAQTSCVANTNHWDHHSAFEQTRGQSMSQQAVLRRDDISEFISKMYEGDQEVGGIFERARLTGALGGSR